jgi:hypothetical protein
MENTPVFESLDQPVTVSRKMPESAFVSSTALFSVVGAFLQQPRQFFQEVRAGIEIYKKIGALLLSSSLFLAAYGAVLGSGHPLLSLNAAFAVPILFLGSLATCVPVMYLLDVLSGSQRSLSQMVVVLATSLCAGSTVFFSFAPIMIVFRLTGSLQQYFWLNVGVLAMSMLVGLIYLTQGLLQTTIVDAAHGLSVLNKRLHLLWMFLFAMVISQMAWGMLNFYQSVGGFMSLLR